MLSTLSDLSIPVSILLEASPLLISLTCISSKSLSLIVLLDVSNLLFLSFLISSLILIIPSALPILLILSDVAFPAFWKSGATLWVSSPLATKIAVMTSVASIRTSSVTPLPSSFSIDSRPSRISSPSSTIVVTSFSVIQSIKATLMYFASSDQSSVNSSFSNTILNTPSFHLSMRNFLFSSIPLDSPLVFSIPFDFSSIPLELFPSFIAFTFSPVGVSSAFSLWYFIFHPSGRFSVSPNSSSSVSYSDASVVISSTSVSIGWSSGPRTRVGWDTEPCVFCLSPSG